MRPVLIAWAATHHIPVWLVPDYFSLVGLSGALFAAIALSLALRDGADLAREARALSLAYAGALLGG